LAPVLEMEAEQLDVKRIRRLRGDILAVAVECHIARLWTTLGCCVNDGVWRMEHRAAGQEMGMADRNGSSKGKWRHMAILWWLQDGGSFRAQGIFGQDIFIDPTIQLVIGVAKIAREHADRSERWGNAGCILSGRSTDVAKQ